jgi:hypothetical protein
MIGRTIVVTALLIAATLAFGVCDPAGTEPGPVSLPVVTADTGATPCTNDLGWVVEVSSLRVAVRDLELTIEGETHASLLDRLRELAVPSVLAHPGHYAGGEVTGELPGEFVVDLASSAGQALGDATLLPGDYNGMNLHFRAAGEGDGLETGDPLLGHSAVIAGSAAKGEVAIAFTAVLDIEDGTQMVGAPFELAVDAGTDATLALTAFTIDPSESDTLFDGLDFDALDGDEDGAVAIEPGQEAHNILMKTLVRHDHWGIEVRQP